MSTKEFDMSNDILEKPALDVLLDHSIHSLVRCMASRFRQNHGRKAPHSVMLSEEDIAHEGYIGVTVAYTSFDPNKGHTDDMVKSFRTHCFPYIKSAMLTYCRKFGHSLSISEKAARYDFNDLIGIGIVHMDQLPEDESFDLPIGSGVDATQDVDEYFMTGFTQLERNMIRDNVIDGYSLQEVADRYNLSKSRAGEILRGLMERMRARAEDYVKNN